ncbi:MAG: type II toxin-antitoxin system Phd/YefM family antitoxin [Acidimicrobiia bacterium]|nr:type II toxin-antitoxin system Phd/YefM family antitoxin [Acidimicrobiia bacterium]
MERIGIRELRQNASRYLARVRAGETIEVTDRGRPVARLVPVIEESWDDLVHSGQLLEAEQTNVGTALPEPLDIGFSPSSELESLRSQER